MLVLQPNCKRKKMVALKVIAIGLMLHVGIAVIPSFGKRKTFTKA